MRELHHPTPEQMSLPAVLEALSDPTRLDIVVRLARQGEAQCAAFLVLGSKTNLSYHFTRLREAGVVHVQPQGTRRLLTLRRDALDTRFPGLLDGILRNAPKPSVTGTSPSESYTV